jgi:hypothetical protein
MGDRVRVIHDDDDRLVAAKSPPPDDPGRAHREATLLSGLRHPGVVEFVGLTEGERGPEVLTRWVSSRTLADLPRPIEPARAAGIVLAVAATIEDIHRLGVVHRRLDATHVLLDARGRPVLCGFGDAARTDAAPPDDEAEAARPSVDVAGLGALLLDLLAEGDSPDATSRPLRPSRPSRSVRARRRALEAIARQATAEEPTCRPGVRAFADAVRAAAPDATLDLRSERPERPERPERRPVGGQAERPLDPAKPRTPVGDPLLALLAEEEPPASGCPTAPAATIEAPLVTDVEPTEGLLQELDLLRPRNEHRDRRHRPGRGTVGGLSLVLGLAVLGFLGVSVLSTNDAADSQSAPQPTPAPTTAPTVAKDADGGPGSGRVEGSTPEVEHQGVRYRVGRPGDLVAVGDWRCTGEPLPAVYRPSTGSLFVFPAWPEVGRTSDVAPVLAAPDGLGLEAGPPDPAGCPTLVLRDGRGRPTTIDREVLS